MLILITLIRIDILKRETSRDEYIRKRNERRKKIRRRRMIYAFSFLIAILLCVAVILSLTVFFPIELITASGSKIYTNEQILNECEIKTGDNLFAVSEGKTEETLKQKLPYIESIDFVRKLPDTLEIVITDAKEHYCYQIDSLYYTVSDKGWVLSETDTPILGIPVIIGDGVNCKVGSSIEFTDLEQKALVESLAEHLLDMDIDTQIIDVTDMLSIKLKVENRFEVNLGTTNFVVEKIKHLAGMIENIAAEKSGKSGCIFGTASP